MPIIATKGSGTNFAPAPDGAHSAVCVDVVDLGNLDVTYNKKTKSQHKIKIVWQIDEDRDDGKPHQVSQRYTLSLHEKAKLRADLESWRGKPFTDAELEGFDVENVIGVACMVNVVHNLSAGNVYANVAAIMKLPKGVPPLKAREYTRVIDREPLPAGTPADATQPNWGEITDDDIPF